MAPSVSPAPVHDSWRAPADAPRDRDDTKSWFGARLGQIAVSELRQMRPRVQALVGGVPARLLKHLDELTRVP